jgi:DNA-binding NarL/FixJ family response regulator
MERLFDPRRRILSPLPSLSYRANVGPGFLLTRHDFEWMLDTHIRYVLGQGPPVWFPTLCTVITPDSPPDDQHVLVYRFVRKIVESHGPANESGPLRAFQVVVSDRGAEVRVNQGIRGVLVGSIREQPNDSTRADCRLDFELLPDEPDNATSYTVLQSEKAEVTTALVFWDSMPSVIRRLSDDGIVRMILRSLPTRGPKGRWKMLLGRGVDPAVVRGALWLAWRKGMHKEKVALDVLEQVERGLFAGSPSRTSDASTVPIPDEAESSGSQELATETPDPSARIDLLRRLETLPEKAQEILRLHAAGYKDGEIAARLGITQQAANAARHRAAAQLRRLLTQA